MASGSSSQRSSVKSTPIRGSTESPTFNDLYKTGSKLPFKLVFVDLQKVVCDALKAKFPSHALDSNEIEVCQGKFESYLESNNIDCIVSSSNAFGLMDHGFDRSVCKVLSDNNNEIRIKIQQEIINRYYGEQPIGTCIIIETNNSKIKYLAHSPTRRVNYSIKGTDNIYTTIRAICNEIRVWNEDNSDDQEKQIKNVLLTGLGTFYGAVSPEESARQTVLGWLFARLPKPNINDMNWENAKLRQSLIGYGGFNHFVNYIKKYPEHSLSKTQQKKLAKCLPKKIISELHEENQAVSVSLSPNAQQIHHDAINRDNDAENKAKNKKDCAIM